MTDYHFDRQIIICTSCPKSTAVPNDLAVFQRSVGSKTPHRSAAVLHFCWWKGEQRPCCTHRLVLLAEDWHSHCCHEQQTLSLRCKELPENNKPCVSGCSIADNPSKRHWKSQETQMLGTIRHLLASHTPLKTDGSIFQCFVSKRIVGWMLAHVGWWEWAESQWNVLKQENEETCRNGDTT